MKKLSNISMRARANKIVEWHGFSLGKAMRLVKRDYLNKSSGDLMYDNYWENETVIDSKNKVQLSSF